MTVDELFALTQEERARVESARSMFPDADWVPWAATVQEGLLDSYAKGDVDLRRALQMARSCALCCDLAHRMGQMAVFVERALLISPPRKRGRRRESRDQSPPWVRRSAVNLVKMFAANSPSEPWTPTYWNDRTSPILKRAIDWLVASGLLAKHITSDTLYNWCREVRRAPDVDSIVTRVASSTRTRKQSR